MKVWTRWPFHPGLFCSSMSVNSLEQMRAFTFHRFIVWYVLKLKMRPGRGQVFWKKCYSIVILHKCIFTMATLVSSSLEEFSTESYWSSVLCTGVIGNMFCSLRFLSVFLSGLIILWLRLRHCLVLNLGAGMVYIHFLLSLKAIRIGGY